MGDEGGEGSEYQDWRATECCWAPEEQTWDRDATGAGRDGRLGMEVRMAVCGK